MSSSPLDIINQRFPWPLRLAVVIAAGILSGFLLSLAVAPYHPIKAKLLGAAPYCPWRKTFSAGRDATHFEELYRATLPTLRVLRHDLELNLLLVASPIRRFWIKALGETTPGPELLAYLLAEHDWMAESAPAKMVRRGDYVLDCGAHVGIFTHQALQLGARTVVAIEPEPVNRECLRRNFREEIASGRVIVVPKGVWSSHGVLTLSLGVDNSGANTVVLPGGSGAIQIPVTTIDDLVRDLTIPRVDYIKMDIEGAEREALRGAAATLRTFRPRVLAENHRPDDMLVLPGLLRQAHASYAAVCGPCVIQRGLLVPHVVFYD